MFNWDDLRHFLELSRRGRLISAAQHLQVDHTTVSRRIAALEESLNTRLFDRTPHGYQLTKAGQSLLTHAEAMEAQSIGLYQDVSGEDATLSGTVRMAATEGLAIEFLSRHMDRFREQHPGIVLELVASTPPLNLSRREADLAITLSRPQTGRLIAWKLSWRRSKRHGQRLAFQIEDGFNITGLRRRAIDTDGQAPLRALPRIRSLML